jgi:murein DD-endopeptidase MepM/ murein hydrolase activator NlpD
MPVTAAADEGYRLPWRAGASFTMTQGWGGSYTHSGAQMYYAYDFNMPVGTDVLAAKGGTVTAAVGSYRRCGYDKSWANKGNRVTINHGDGSATLYLHLESVTVTVGQKVRQGQVIGLGIGALTGGGPLRQYVPASVTCGAVMRAVLASCRRRTA